MERPKGRLTPAMIVAGCLLTIYVVCYLAIVRPDYGATPAVEVPTQYRIGGRAAERVFWPANQLDRRIRRKTWYGPHG
jgi:hypothetical protein